MPLTDRLVGRGEEIAVLRALLVSVQDGHGGLVLLVGEPGIGKSELAYCADDLARGEGFTVVWGRCRESAQAPPFWPWRQAMRALGAEALTRAPGPGTSRFAVFDSVLSALGQASASASVLVVLDDVHRADEASLEVLRFAVAQLFPARVGLVLTARASEGPPLVREVLADAAESRHGRRVELPPLTVADVAAWIGRAGVTAGGDAEAVHARTGGNPFFIREVLRLRASGVHDLPGAVRDAVRRRLALLPPATRAALDAAAVLGRDFGEAGLAAVLKVGPAAAAAAVGPAVDARLVTSAPDGMRGRFQFVHVLT